MATRRYTIEDDVLGKWLIEDLAETAMGIATQESTRVTLKDCLSGKRVRAAGADYQEALERACRKMGISAHDLGEELRS